MTLPPPSAELRGLLEDRARLLRQLAPVLRRAGPDNPQRAAINAKRAIIRKRVRAELRRNAFAIAAHCASLYDIHPQA